MIIKEFCAENFTHVPEAVELGVDRIELCDRLDLGGTTPSNEIQRQTIEHAHRHHVDVVCMIRPRGGSFEYTKDEKVQMLKQAEEAFVNGADGIVFGALTKDNTIDWPFIDKLLERAQRKQTVFHMAFDVMSKEDQVEALTGLIERNVTRILTRGSQSGTALENCRWINALIEKAEGKIEILAGGGITHNNLNQAIEIIQTSQFHGTKIVDI